MKGKPKGCINDIGITNNTTNRVLYSPTETVDSLRSVNSELNKERQNEFGHQKDAADDPVLVVVFWKGIST